MEKDTTQTEKKQETQTETPTTKKPDYIGDGIAIWLNTDKNNNSYLSIKMIGHNTVYASKRQ
jgi:hypothetical protein